MLRYKTETRPGLVAFYDIRSGNGAGQFLQPQRPHGAKTSVTRSHYSECSQFIDRNTESVYATV